MGDASRQQSLCQMRDFVDLGSRHSSIFEPSYTSTTQCCSVPLRVCCKQAKPTAYCHTEVRQGEHTGKQGSAASKQSRPPAENSCGRCNTLLRRTFPLCSQNVGSPCVQTGSVAAVHACRDAEQHSTCARPAASRNCGSCVVLPLPVSPTSTSVEQRRTSATSCCRAAQIGSACRAACSAARKCCAAPASRASLQDALLLLVLCYCLYCASVREWECETVCKWWHRPPP